MCLRILKSGLLLTLLLAALAGCTRTVAKPEPGGYTDKAENFIDTMVDQHGFDRDELTTLFSQAQRRDDIIELMSKPAEKKLRWFEYRKIFLTQSRIQGGVSFWQANAAILEKAGQAYGIEPQIIVAIIGTWSGAILDILRDSLFTITSLVTTTGYGTADFGLWPAALQIMVLGLMFNNDAPYESGNIKRITKEFLAEIDTEFGSVSCRNLKQTKRQDQTCGATVVPRIAGILERVILRELETRT